VLTGVDLTAWGQDLPDKPPLGRLVRHILRAVPALRWLRLSSIDAAEADPELQEMLSFESRFAPYLHLSLQSGNTLILKRMKRRHTRDDALQFIAQLRAQRPDLALGADFIAGFPTEDDAMFADTLSFIDEAKIAYVHAFGFSPRQGTPAARMPQVPPAIVKERAQQLRAHAQTSLQRHLLQQVGQSKIILAETATTGRCADFTPVQLNAPVVRGQFYTVAMESVSADKMVARVV
jgi:threonylcarbamoyladenosine tRNA methylthiotransferase MtaB